MNKRQKKKLAKQKILASYQTTPKRAKQLYREERLVRNNSEIAYQEQLSTLRSEWRVLVNKCNELVTKIQTKINQFVDEYGPIINWLSDFDLKLSDILKHDYQIDFIEEVIQIVSEIAEHYHIKSFMKGRLLGVRKIDELLDSNLQEQINRVVYDTVRDFLLDGNKTMKFLQFYLVQQIKDLIGNTVETYHDVIREDVQREIDSVEYHYGPINTWSADDE